MSEVTNESKAKKGGTKAVFAVGILIIAVLLAAVVYLLLTRNDEPEVAAVNRNVVVNEENVEEILKGLDDSKIVGPGRFNTIMTGEWNFPSGDAPSEDAYVENSVRNTRAFYFDVIREDTGEVIYESPILPVGSHLENITLDTNLENGTYDCLMNYHLLDNDYKDVDSVQWSLTINVGQN